MQSDQSDGNASGEVSSEAINRFARSISDGPLGLVHHRPQKWAEPHLCYNNVSEMVEREGGRGQSGWLFYIRTRPGVGNYVFAQPHAVWYKRDGSLVDVTPHRDPEHLPVIVDGSVLFLVDSAADPVGVADGEFLSPPLRFCAAGDSPTLKQYVAELNEKSAADFEREKKAILARARH